MTTNAIDRNLKIIASDSRWSTYVDGHFCFVDDTGFDKIGVRDFGAIICAGDGILIQEWRDWFFAERLVKPHPRTERIEGETKESIDITMLAAGTGRILINRGNYTALEQDALFAGSGQLAAANCFFTNRCAKKAVESAASVDMQTGGATLFANLVDGSHNTGSSPATHDHAYIELLNRGTAMNLTTKKFVPVKDVLRPGSGSPNASNSSEYTLSAPTGRGYSPWTEDEKLELSEAVDELIRLQDELRK